MAKPNIDLLIKNVTVFNVFLKKFVAGDVSVSNGRFFSVGKHDLSDYSISKEIDGQGYTLVPGLIDIHLHIESSMVTPQPFAQELIKHGVTTVVSDPHEIANVFGIEGIEAMIEAGRESCCDIFYGVPSCVPATDLETAGDKIDFADFSKLHRNSNTVCLGEVMSYVQLVKEQDSAIHELLEKIRTNYPRTIIEGHCPNYMGLDLATFMYHGPDADHTMQTVITIDERIKMGMMVQLQDKSITKEVIEHLEKAGYDEHIALVTDDVAPDKLIEQGHLDYLIRKAIKYGLSPEKALYWSTYTPARRMQLLDRGSIAPGKIADFIMVRDVNNFVADRVYKNGKLVFESGQELKPLVRQQKFSAKFYQSVKLPMLSAEDFKVAVLHKDGEVYCRGMQIKDKTTFTESVQVPLAVKDGYLKWQESGWALIAIFHRHGHNRNVSFGLVGGVVLKRGAVATTYAHDSHNLLVVGHSPEEMVLAANHVITAQGGICVVEGARIAAQLALPIAGLMCEDTVDVAAKGVTKIRIALETLGYAHSFPIMSLATLSLPVSPSLKISDLGLVDVINKKLVDLVINA